MGRPKKDEVDRIRVQAWYASVKQQSGFESAYMHGKHFSNGHFAFRRNKESFHPSNWNKYERGEDVPNPNLVENVEKEFKGTNQWLHQSLWEVIRKKPPTYLQIKDIVGSVRPSLAKYIFDETDPRTKDQKGFLKLWAPPIIDSLIRQCDLKSMAALCALMRYAEIQRNNSLYAETAIASLRVLLVLFLKEAPMYAVKDELYMFLHKHYFESTPDHEFNLALLLGDIKGIVDHFRLVADRARSYGIIENKDKEIGRLFYWMGREGLFKIRSNLLSIDQLVNPYLINEIKIRMSTSDKYSPARKSEILEEIMILAWRREHHIG